jgi:NADH dehydrogenase FAD-containing subunit
MVQQETRVLVIGAGYAGLLAAVRLAMQTRKQNVQITLVNPVDSFVERPRLHQLAANQPLHRRSIPAVLRGTGVQFLRGTVTAIDRKQCEVILESMNGRRLAYDYLIVATGSTIDRDSVPGVRPHAYTLTPAGPHSAEALKNQLPELNRQGGRLVVVGGGPTGIEAAAEFAEAYPGLRVSLVAQGKLGHLFGGEIQTHMVKTLAHLGVSIRDQTTVSRVEAHRLVTSQGEFIPFDVCLWAGGFVAPSLARESGLAVNERGQLLTDLTLCSITDPQIYAAGDSAQLIEKAGPRIRMAAYTATITGAAAADSLGHALNGKPQPPLNFAYLGQGIALGRHDAVGFNNFPDDQPNWPVFTGWLAVLGREFFIYLLGKYPEIEHRLPGLHFWPSRGHRKPEARPQVEAGEPHSFQG